MRDSFDAGGREAARNALRQIQAAFQSLGADPALPNIFHAIVNTKKCMQYEWPRLMCGDTEVRVGSYTWPSREPIEYYYFIPGARRAAQEMSSPNQTAVEAGNRVVPRALELGDKVLAIVNGWGAVHGVNVADLSNGEDWVCLLYRFAWKYPSRALSAQRFRIFRPPEANPLTRDPTYHAFGLDVRVPLEHPSALNRQTDPITWEHDGRTHTEIFSEAFAHAYYAALTPDLCTASVRVIAALARPERGQEAVTPQRTQALPASTPVDTAKKIPPRKRTRPMTYREAAHFIGKGDSRDAAEWLSAAVAAEAIACEHITRQTHVFNVDDFPANVLPNILPK
jgi:hypothetical protein